MSELERAVVLLIARYLNLEGVGPAAADPELRDLVILLAKRNRAGADPTNIARRARAASGIVAVDNKLHDPYVMGSRWEGELEDADLLSHASELVMPPQPSDIG